MNGVMRSMVVEAGKFFVRVEVWPGILMSEGRLAQQPRSKQWKGEKTKDKIVRDCP